MPRSNSVLPSRLGRDASRLVALSLALHSSGSRVEDTYWEAELSLLINRLLENGDDQAIEAALDHLSQQHLGGYEVLMEQAETLSESCVIEKDGVNFDVLLILAPLVAWTRYSIPANNIAPKTVKTLSDCLKKHILATDVQLALMPKLASLDQMPRSFSETWQWLHSLGAQCLGLEAKEITLNSTPEAFNMLADTRYLVAAVAVKQRKPIFHWQQEPGELGEGRLSAREKWAADTQTTFAQMIPGCGFEILVPDAYYVSNREADRQVRPLSVKAAVTWLCGALNLEPKQLRAIVAGCGEDRPEEYRIGFTQRNQNEVIYGCLWPMYGREDDQNVLEPEAPPRDTAQEIVALIKTCGITDVRCLPNLLALDFCDDCGAPYFPNPAGELVHAELPEDAETAPSHFH
jgi:hypothetical protein